MNLHRLPITCQILPPTPWTTRSAENGPLGAKAEAALFIDLATLELPGYPAAFSPFNPLPPPFLFLPFLRILLSPSLRSPRESFISIYCGLCGHYGFLKPSLPLVSNRLDPPTPLPYHFPQFSFKPNINTMAAMDTATSTGAQHNADLRYRNVAEAGRSQAAEPSVPEVDVKKSKAGQVFYHGPSA